jgi:hypothetical protein
VRWRSVLFRRQRAVQQALTIRLLCQLKSGCASNRLLKLRPCQQMSQACLKQVGLRLVARCASLSSLGNLNHTISQLIARQPFISSRNFITWRATSTIVLVRFHLVVTALDGYCDRFLQPLEIQLRLSQPSFTLAYVTWWRGQPSECKSSASSAGCSASLTKVATLSTGCARPPLRL